MAGMDTEMIDVADLMDGGETGTTPNVENTTRAVMTEGYAAHFTRNTVEEVERDVIEGITKRLSCVRTSPCWRQSRLLSRNHPRRFSASSRDQAGDGGVGSQIKSISIQIHARER